MCTIVVINIMSVLICASVCGSLCNAFFVLIGALCGLSLVQETRRISYLLMATVVLGIGECMSLFGCDLLRWVITVLMIQAHCCWSYFMTITNCLSLSQMRKKEVLVIIEDPSALRGVNMVLHIQRTGPLN